MLPMTLVFFFEALAVCYTIHTITNMDDTLAKLPIYTDNPNTMSMFNSLWARPVYNSLLLSAVDILITYNVNLWMEHIPDQQNIIADALSWFHNKLMKDLVPLVQIFNCEPPQDILEVAET
ncbi:hypothetical protein BDR06DRAFT_875932 [Suillus hirtellus]|nr:hypothetical protein BDR06DRAFT_875932 [Suillus hirtellus]